MALDIQICEIANVKIFEKLPFLACFFRVSGVVGRWVNQVSFSHLESASHPESEIYFESISKFESVTGWALSGRDVVRAIVRHAVFELILWSSFFLFSPLLSVGLSPSPPTPLPPYPRVCIHADTQIDRDIHKRFRLPPWLFGVWGGSQPPPRKPRGGHES